MERERGGEEEKRREEKRSPSGLGAEAEKRGGAVKGARYLYKNRGPVSNGCQSLGDFLGLFSGRKH